jgi:hypothetical protein
MPVVENVGFEALETQIDGDDGQLLSRITWTAGGVTQVIEAMFQLHRSKHLDEAWDIERMLLLDELRRVYG